MPTAPQLNINGTSAAELMKQCLEALSALRVADEALRGMHPNGRDYPNGGLNIAIHEHVERLNSLDKLKAEVEAIALNIQEQDDKRKSACPIRVVTPTE